MSNAENQRLRALRDLKILDTLPEACFDRLTALAASLFDAPIALVSLIDQERQWFKSRFGLDAVETPRAWAFCDHAIAKGPHAVMVVEDATQDDRFAQNPLVTGAPDIRFYAGAVLTTSAGDNLGTLCVIDRTARPTPSKADMQRLETLAHMVVDEFELRQAHREMAKQQRLLEMAEAMSGVGHWRYDVADDHVTWSREVGHIHGVDPATFDPNLYNALSFFPPDDLAMVQALLARAISHGEDYAFQLRLNRADGQQREVACKATCEIGADGVTTGVFGVFQDVTDQVEALATVKKSEARYRLLTENANDIVTKMGPDGVFRYVSPAVRAVTGYDADEVIGRVALEFIHPDDHTYVRQAFAQALQGPAGWRIEYRVICKDGRVIWVEARPTIARNAETGETIGVTDVIRDITDHKMAEMALAESEARYRLLADNAGDMIAQFKPDGTITFISPGCRQVLGYAPGEMIGWRTLDLIHPDDIQGVRAYYKALAETSGVLPDPLQFRGRHKGGAWVWLEGHPKMFFDPASGEPLEMQDVVRDVTARKRLEDDLRQARAEAEAAAAVKSEFLANMSHELRTPLTSILGFSKLLTEEAGLGETGQRYLQRVSDASQSLLTTVNDILDFSKLEAGQVEIAARSIDAAAVIQGAIDLLAPQAAAKGLYLRADMAGLPTSLMADDARVRQILLNLINNAVKFTTAGGITVKARHDAATARLCCEVIDTGQGVPADRLDCLFKRFSQVDASTTRSHGGTGLGLAICKGLAEAMGGEVGADSQEGKGSRFWFEISAPGPASTQAPAATLEGVDALFGLRILAIDDNAVSGALLRLILTPFGVELTQTNDANEGVRLANAAPFDLILISAGLDDAEGCSPALAIRAGGGPNADVPVIALADAHDPEAVTAVFDDRLFRPIIAADLLSVLNAWNPANAEATDQRRTADG